jgi:hypothetical protein
LAREEVRTGCTAVAGRDELRVRAVDIHRVDLIAGVAFARRLKDQLLAVGGEVSLGVLAAEGQLFQVPEVFLLRQEKLVVAVVISR